MTEFIDRLNRPVPHGCHVRLINDPNIAGVYVQFTGHTHTGEPILQCNMNNRLINYSPNDVLVEITNVDRDRNIEYIAELTKI